MGWSTPSPWKPKPKPVITKPVPKPVAKPLPKPSAPWSTVKLNSGVQGVPVPRDPTGQSNFSSSQIQAAQRAWNAQNPNATNYFHAYASSPEDLGRMMREDPEGYAAIYQAYNPIGGGGLPASLSSLSGGGGYGGGGGGGGGGAAAPAGMDQATFDYLSSILGQGRPKELGYEAIDLAEPTWDNALYNQARQGVTSGIEAMRGRGNAAFDRAGVELNQYQNPYGAGLQTRAPDMQGAMQRMMNANGVNPGAVQTTQGEMNAGDRGMANTLAMLAATDQSRQAANQRALAGDRTVMEQNLGLEGNMLNLGVNMAETKGKTAWQAQVDAIRQQEALANWQRKNQVGDTNVANSNTWMQNALQSYLQLVAGKAPGGTLPANGTLPWAV